MTDAYFVAQTAAPSSLVPTVRGPFVSEEEALMAAHTMPPGAYTVFGPASAGKTFSISQPVLTITPARVQEPFSISPPELKIDQ